MLEGKRLCCQRRSPCALESPHQGPEHPTCLLPASESPGCPLAGGWPDAGVSEGVRAVADPGVGKGRRSFVGAGQPVTPAAANTGSLSASSLAKHKPSCCGASRSQQRPRSGLECRCRLGPKAVVNRTINGALCAGSEGGCSRREARRPSACWGWWGFMSPSLCEWQEEGRIGCCREAVGQLPALLWLCW